MATKKEKHVQALARRAERLEKNRQLGLQSLEASRKKREIEIRDEWQETHDKKHHKFINECPLCQDIKKDIKRKEAQKAVGKVAKASANT